MQTVAGKIDSGAVAIGTGWTEIHRIRTNNNEGTILANFEVVTNAITGFRVAHKSHSGAEEKVIAEDAGLATATVKIPMILGTSVHTTVAGASFDLQVEVMGSYEIAFYAKRTSAATVRARGVYNIRE